MFGHVLSRGKIASLKIHFLKVLAAVISSKLLVHHFWTLILFLGLQICVYHESTLRPIHQCIWPRWLLWRRRIIMVGTFIEFGLVKLSILIEPEVRSTLRMANVLKMSSHWALRIPLWWLLLLKHHDLRTDILVMLIVMYISAAHIHFVFYHDIVLLKQILK